MTRSVLYILLPLSFILAIALLSQGVVQTFTRRKRSSWFSRTSTRRARPSPLRPYPWDRRLRRSPSSSSARTAAASSTPTRRILRNPTPLSNFLEMVAIILIPAALCYTFGRWWATRSRVGDLARHDHRASASVVAAYRTTSRRATRRRAARSLDRRHDRAARRQHGGQGGTFRNRQFVHLGGGHHRCLKRLGRQHARLFTPLGGLVPLVMIHLGEVIFGGVGPGSM